MKYPYLLSHIRFHNAGTKLKLTEGGGMTQDVFASTKEDVKDRMGRRVVLERHEHDVVIYRETLNQDNQPSGEFEVLHTFHPSSCVVMDPVDPKLCSPSLPETAPAPAAPAAPAAPKGLAALVKK
jgi:hypothetical protein